MRRLVAFVLFVTVLVAIEATAQPVQAKHSTVELLSRESTLSPGAEVLLGVHFVLETGWHIYWINPGDSGQPPAFKWQLPPGLTPGEIQWPRPERMQNSPQLADYGYHGQALLMVPVRFPAQWTGGTAEIGLDAKWLICREVCLPDHAQLHLSLSASTSGANQRDSATLFAGAVKLVPKPLPPGWKASAMSRKGDFVLSVGMPGRVTQAQFFPLDPAQVDNAAQQRLESAPHGMKMILKKSEYLVKQVSMLRGVLVMGPDAYQIEAPVIAGKE
jgi:thiol:disulfide interchange protein DsbD